jgi:hypothetical protein
MGPGASLRTYSDCHNRLSSSPCRSTTRRVPARFAHTQPSAIRQHQHRPGGPRGDRAEQARDLRRRQHDGQAHRLLASGDARGYLGPPERGAVDKPFVCRHGDLPGTGARLRTPRPAESPAQCRIRPALTSGQHRRSLRARARATTTQVTKLPRSGFVQGSPFGTRARDAPCARTRYDHVLAANSMRNHARAAVTAAKAPYAVSG